MNKPKTLLSLAAACLLVLTSLLVACESQPETTVTTTQTQTVTQTTTPEPDDPDPSVKNPGTVIKASLNSVETLDIHFMSASSDTYIAYNVYDALLSSDLEGELFPSLATKVPTTENGLITTADDGATTIAFPIREGVSFHNGDTLTPEDVKYTFLRGIISGRMGTIGQALLDEDSYANLTDREDLESVFQALDSSIEIDGGKVVFHLPEPFSPFLEIIACNGAIFGIINKSWAIDQGAWPATADTMGDYMDLTTAENELHDKMMGTGPFKLSQWQLGERVVLERNDDYWQGPAEIERVIRRIVTDSDTALQMLRAGDADIIPIGKPALELVKGYEGIKTVEDIPVAQLIKINFNYDIQGDRFIGNGQFGSNGAPADLFSDINVRKGFCYAFDYEIFVDEVLAGAGITPYGPVLVGFPTANPENPQYYLDLEKAEEYFRQAFDGDLWEKGFKLTVPYNEGNQPRQSALEILKSNLQSINPKFELEITSLPWAAYVGSVNDREMPLSIFGTLPSYRHPYASLHHQMHSSGYYPSLKGFDDRARDKYDSLIDEIARTFDENRIEEISHELQRLAYEDAIAIFHHQAISQIAMREWIEGYEMTRAPSLIDFYKISKP